MDDLRRLHNDVYTVYTNLPTHLTAELTETSKTVIICQRSIVQHSQLSAIVQMKLTNINDDNFILCSQNIMQ